MRQVKMKAHLYGGSDIVTTQTHPEPDGRHIYNNY